MTESDRHRNSISKTKDALRKLGHSILENTDDGGRGGYRLPAVICLDGKPRSFVIDCLCRLKTGAMLAFEIDLNHATTRHKLWALRSFFITPVYPINPKDVDIWHKDPSILEAEIAYRTRNVLSTAPANGGVV